jgi:hypothetical protein
MVHFLTAFAWGYPCDHAGAICNALTRVKLPFSARYPLNEQSSIFINKDAHYAASNLNLRQSSNLG